MTGSMLYDKRYPLYAIISTNSYVRIYKLFMQNKPNFRNDKMNITLDMTSNYKILSALWGQKTKPIQTQFKANKAKNKPNLSQNKPNQTQSDERPKMMQSEYLQGIKKKYAAMAIKKQTLSCLPSVALAKGGALALLPLMDYFLALFQFSQYLSSHLKSLLSLERHILSFLAECLMNHCRINLSIVISNTVASVVNTYLPWDQRRLWTIC